MDAFLERLKRMDSVRYVHGGVIEQPWGQRPSGSTTPPICTSSRSANPWRAW
ncbi:glyoxalase/bleomycin resistance/dioxygenase family protein [Methanoculleus chikugoensis]|uniref:glyoxalase/bleomycin resistance/dioxygenase family protein n=1 Tax=Methanoculleus chikugoensis TaxID=118126 RepID=UPI001FB4759B|nr:glyoxalase/bleomycin resistance/dioxygenase family protein [Methanoculleus chikugoensis]